MKRDLRFEKKVQENGKKGHVSIRLRDDYFLAGRVEMCYFTSLLLSFKLQDPK